MLTNGGILPIPENCVGVASTQHSLGTKGSGQAADRAQDSQDQLSLVSAFFGSTKEALLSWPDIHYSNLKQEQLFDQ